MDVKTYILSLVLIFVYSLLFTVFNHYSASIPQKSCRLVSASNASCSTISVSERGDPSFSEIPPTENIPTAAQVFSIEHSDKGASVDSTAEIRSIPSVLIENTTTVPPTHSPTLSYSRFSVNLRKPTHTGKALVLSRLSPIMKNFSAVASFSKKIASANMQAKPTFLPKSPSGNPWYKTSSYELVDIRKRYVDLRKLYLKKTRVWRVYQSKVALYYKKKKKGVYTTFPASPPPTPSLPPIREKPDFNGMDDPIPNLTHHFSVRPWAENEVIRIRRFQGNRELSSDIPNVLPAPDAPHVDASHCFFTPSYSRIFYIPHLMKRWKGMLSLLLYGTDVDEQRIIQYLDQRSYDSRLSLVVYLVRNGTEESQTFPINALRNIAIRNSQSTHYMVIDFDVWPTYNLYDEFSRVNPALLARDDVAIILPLVFFDVGMMLNFCRELSDCIRFGVDYMPEDKKQLDACLKGRVCMLEKNFLVTHLYLTKLWMRLEETNIVEMKCFKNSFQEPYVMVKRSKNVPLFDERFVNYGFNKMQFIEHLRYMGFKFMILTNSFAVDMPHRNSKFKAKFLREGNSTSSMEEVFEEFKEELSAKYQTTNKLPICASEKTKAIYKGLTE